MISKREYLSAAWCSVLGIDRAEREQNFFDLGGDSLAALELAGKLADSIGWDLPMDILFSRATLGSLEDALCS